MYLRCNLYADEIPSENKHLHTFYATVRFYNNVKLIFIVA